MPVSSVSSLDHKDNKEDKTREEADMTPSPVFQKSSNVAQNCPKSALLLLLLLLLLFIVDFFLGHPVHLSYISWHIMT